MTAGLFVAIVGPSGAGKDTIIAYARDRLPSGGPVRFVRRVITRPCDGVSEIHDSLGEAEFAEASAEGAFCVSWSAHGLSYGIPASAVGDVATGYVVVANVSRAALGEVADRFDRLKVVEITARAEILAERLARRGRERGDMVAARLSRSAAIEAEGLDVVVIDNSGAKEVAGETLIALLQNAAATEARTELNK